MTATPHPPPSTSDTLQLLLGTQLQLPAEYQDQLTNHLPMALQALHSLGASPERMQAFYAAYAKRFHGMQARAAAQPATDWRSLRGQVAAYPALLASMHALVVRDGVDATLRSLLPDLLPGVAAAAFHGPIRTAHAVQERPCR